MDKLEAFLVLGLGLIVSGGYLALSALSSLLDPMLSGKYGKELGNVRKVQTKDGRHGVPGGDGP